MSKFPSYGAGIFEKRAKSKPQRYCQCGQKIKASRTWCYDCAAERDRVRKNESRKRILTPAPDSDKRNP